MEVALACDAQGAYASRVEVEDVHCPGVSAGGRLGRRAYQTRGRAVEQQKNWDYRIIVRQSTAAGDARMLPAYDSAHTPSAVTQVLTSCIEKTRDHVALLRHTPPTSCYISTTW